MYTIYLDDQLFYHPLVPNLETFETELNTQVNVPATLKFRIYSNHRFFSQVETLTSYFKVLEDDLIVFKGRAIDINPGMDNSFSVDVEGALDYLNDTILKPYNYSGSVQGFLKMILDYHNSVTDQIKKIKLGKVTVVDPNDYIVRSSITYDNAYDTVQEKLLKLLGGYLILRYEGDDVYLDYLEDSSAKSSQKIQLGTNLVDFDQTVKGNGLITALIPLGTRLKDDDNQMTDERLTVSSLNGGSDTIYNAEAVAKYGWIYGTNIWDDITQPRNLLNSARKFLNERISIGTSMSITAVDLSAIDTNIDKINLFDYVEVINPMHRIDTEILVTQKKINLNEPTKNEITLGTPEKSLTDMSSESGKAVQNINDTYITSAAIKKDNVWLEWTTMDFTTNETKVLFQNEYQSRPAVSLTVFGDPTATYEIKYITEDAEGITVYTGVKLTVLGEGTEINVIAIGRM